jgi:hypothetical protein
LKYSGLTKLRMKTDDVSLDVQLQRGVPPGFRINGSQASALSADVDSDASVDVQVLCPIQAAGHVFKRILPQPTTG